jgi:hypothetical protein
LYVCGKAFYAHLAVQFATLLPQPNDPELCFHAFVLQIEHVTRFELHTNALQRASTAADGSQAHGLGERTGMYVHTPNVYGKLDRNALLTASVHVFSLPR